MHIYSSRVFLFFALCLMTLLPLQGMAGTSAAPTDAIAVSTKAVDITSVPSGHLPLSHVVDNHTARIVGHTTELLRGVGEGQTSPATIASVPLPSGSDVFSKVTRSERIYETILTESSSDHPIGAIEDGPKGPPIVFSFSGGGMRGLLSLKMLRYLCDRLDMQPYEFVDFIGGTSIGGMVGALGLATPQLGGTRPETVAGLEELLKAQYPQIFPGHRMVAQEHMGYFTTIEEDLRVAFNALRHPFQTFEEWTNGLFHTRYPSAPMEAALQAQYGARTLNDVLVPVLVTAVNREEEVANFFQKGLDPLLPVNDYAVWKLARATSAAPTYWEAYSLNALDGTKTGDFLDGGVSPYNNPAQVAFTEAVKLYSVSRHATRHTTRVVSFGTGDPMSDAKVPHSACLLTVVSGLIDTMMTVANRGVNQAMQGYVSHYSYFNPSIKATPLDQYDEKIEAELTRAAQTQHQALDVLADDLKSLVRRYR